jgi:salicylate hydroxylase
MYPHIGQGAAMAIEDGGILGVLLDHCDPSQISNRLELFQRIRHDRVSATQIIARVKATMSSLAEVEELYRDYFPDDVYPSKSIGVFPPLFSSHFCDDNWNFSLTYSRPIRN